MYDEEVEGDENPLANFWMEGDSLAPPCQADMDVVNDILTFANLSSDSILFDLGCGDGRICIEASIRHNCRSSGVEIEERLVKIFQSIVVSKGLTDKVTIIHGDLCSTDFSEATIIVVYLLPEAIELIKPKLLEAVQNGAIIICNTWGPKDWIPTTTMKSGPYGNVTLKKYSIDSILE